MDPHVTIPRHGNSFSLMDGLPELDSTNCHQGQPLEAITTLHVIRGEVFLQADQHRNQQRTNAQKRILYR